MSSNWLTKHIDDIFPKKLKYTRNFDCALQGFAYMPQVNKKTYQLMRARSILRTALSRSTKGRHTREKLLQHISVAYLWGGEVLEGNDSLIEEILQNFDCSDIHEVVRFFWGIQSDQLTPVQVQRMLAFWRACMSHIDESKDGHGRVLSDLALLAAYLNEISGEQKQWLLRIARYVGMNHNTDFFVGYLERLADVSPQEVGEITLAVVKAETPSYDYENRYQSIIRKLLAAGHRHLALDICNQPGLMDLAPIAAIYTAYRSEQDRQRD